MTAVKKMSALETRIRTEFTLILKCHPEHTSYVGNCMASGDHAVDREAEEWIENQLDAGNEWAWCLVEVSGTWNGLSASDYLGCCSYASKADFVECSGYYNDMAESVVANLLKQAEIIRGV